MKRRTFLQNGGKFAGMGLMALSHASNSEAQVIHSGKRIKIGQIGTTHAHAAGKMATLRKLSEDYEVVGIVEPNADRQGRLKNHSAYRGLKWLTEEQLLNAPGLHASPYPRIDRPASGSRPLTLRHFHTALLVNCEISVSLWVLSLRDYPRQ